MDEIRLQGDWFPVRDRLKDQYPELSDEDLVFENGDEDELIERLQKTLGTTRQQTIDIVNAASWNSMSDDAEEEEPQTD